MRLFLNIMVRIPRSATSQGDVAGLSIRVDLRSFRCGRGPLSLSPHAGATACFRREDGPEHKIGVVKIQKKVGSIMPEKPATPMADRISAPTPVEITGGMTAMMKAIDFSIRDHLDRGGQVETWPAGRATRSRSASSIRRRATSVARSGFASIGWGKEVAGTAELRGTSEACRSAPLNAVAARFCGGGWPFLLPFSGAPKCCRNVPVLRLDQRTRRLQRSMPAPAPRLNCSILAATKPSCTHRSISIPNISGLG